MGLAVWDAMMATDCRDILSAVKVPTLVLHRHGDRVADIAGGRHIAERIPDARLLDVPGDDHLLTVGDVDPLLQEIEQFISRTGESDRIVNRVLMTVTCVELRHATRAPVVQDLPPVELFDGRIVTAARSELIVAFAAPSRAITWAASIQQTSRGAGARIAVHTGECEVLGEEVRGLALLIATRAAALAEPGEVLVTGTVKDLVAGSNVVFTSRGVYQLPDAPGEWTLFAVPPTDPAPSI
jgi:class 3 adenylate cyclase